MSAVVSIPHAPPVVVAVGNGSGPTQPMEVQQSSSPANSLKGKNSIAEEDVPELEKQESNVVSSCSSTTSSIISQPSPGNQARAKPQELFALSYENLLKNGEEEKYPNLKELCQKALDLLSREEFDAEMARKEENSHILVEPLLLACKAYSLTLNGIALLIIIELLTQRYLSKDSDVNMDKAKTEWTPLEKAVLGIVAVYTSTNEKNTTNMLKGIILAVSYGKIRHDTLMGLIRLLYTIYGLSKDINNQVIAQMSLLQISRTIFSRIAVDGKEEEAHPKLDTESVENLSAVLGIKCDRPKKAKVSRKLFDFEKAEEEELAVETLTAKMMGSPEAEAEADERVKLGICNVNSDLQVADAFLVMHAFCKLALRELYKEYSSEMRITVLRAKLFALHTILILLSEFPNEISKGKLAFLTTQPDELPRGLQEMTLIDAIRPYLNLILARHLDSTVPKLYELTLAIFEVLITNFWCHFKGETEALMRDMLFPMLEGDNTGSIRVKHTMYTILLSKICKSPHILLDFYATYDCAPNGGRTKIVYQLANSFARLVVALGRADRYIEDHWGDQRDSFQRFARNLDRQDLLKLPPLSIDRFVDNYATRSFFSRYSYADDVLHFRCGTGLLSMTESLMKIANLTLSPVTFEDQPILDSQEDAVETLGCPPLQVGIQLFKRAPKRAIEYLIHQEIIPSNASADIARFLLDTDLDRAKLAIFLSDEANSVLPDFVYGLDLSGLELVTALRRFLAKIWLPSSAQRIDLLLLAFSKRYSELNSVTFPNADTAYALCYAALTLNMNLHSPLLKWRIKKDDFIDSTRGIDHGADVCREVIGEMFDQIKTLAIELSDPLLEPTIENEGEFHWLSDHFPSLALPGQSWVEGYFTHLLRFRYPLNELPHSDLFHQKPEVAIVHSMLKALWMPCFAGASHLAKYSINNQSREAAGATIRRQVLLARELGEETAHTTFFSNLCFFYNHNGGRTISYGNAYATLELFRTVADNANRIRTFWPQILKTVRKMLKDGFVHCYVGRVEKERTLAIFHYPEPMDIYDSFEPCTFTQRILLALDRVFYKSNQLSVSGVVELATHLTQAAAEELSDLPGGFDCQETPRDTCMFLLNRVVDVAYFNLDRIRVEWKALWAVLGPFFCRLGCHSNSSVSRYAVEFLQSLAGRHLALAELPRFKYQRDILSPLVHIIKDSNIIDIQNLALNVVNDLIESNSSQLHSGWEAIFQALAGGAGCLLDDLVQFSFRMAQNVAHDHSKVLEDVNLYSGYLACLSHFAKNTLSQDISIQAIELFNETAMKMVEGHVAEPTEINPWAITFRAAAGMIIEVPHYDVCDKVISLLFSWLNEHGVGFSGEFWEYMLNKILFPLFSQLGQCTQRDGEWVTHTLSLALTKFMEIFTLHFDLLFQYIDGLLDLLSVCLCQEDPLRSKVGADCLQQLLEGNIERMAEKDWQRILSIIVRLFQASSSIDSSLVLPGGSCNYASIQKLKSFESSAPLPLAPTTPEQRNNLCLTVTSLVEKAFLENSKVFTRMEPEFTFIVLDLVERSYVESHQLNSTFDIDTAIKNQSVLKLEKFASVDLTLELNSLVCLVKVLLRMYVSCDAAYQPYHADIVARLVPLCRDAFTCFNAMSRYPLVPGVQEIYQQWHSVVLRVGKFLCISTGQEFQSVFAPISSEIILALKHHHLTPEILEMLATVMGRVDEIYVHGRVESHDNTEELVDCGRELGFPTESSS